MTTGVVSVSNMNLLLCCLAAVVASAYAGHNLPPEMKEMMDALQGQCETESGVDSGVIEEAKKLNFKEDGKFKCFLKCMMVNMEILTQDGIFDHDKVIEHMPEEFKKMGGVDVVHKCKSVTGSDPCDTAFKLIFCFANTSKELAEVFT